MMTCVKLTGCCLLAAGFGLSALAAENAADANAAPATPAAPAAEEAPKKLVKPKKPEYVLWTEASDAAKKSERPVFVYIEFTPEKRCGKLKQAVLAKEEFKALMKDNVVFYSVKVPVFRDKQQRGRNNNKAAPKPDVDSIRKSEVEIVKRFLNSGDANDRLGDRADEYPLFYLVAADGKVVDQLVAPDVEEKPVASLVESLKTAMEKGKFCYVENSKIQKLIKTEQKKYDELQKRQKK